MRYVIPRDTALLLKAASKDKTRGNSQHIAARRSKPAVNLKSEIQELFA